jgi:hypothetical protein
MRSVPGGGYNILVQHYHELRPVGLEQPKVPDSAKIKLEKGAESHFRGLSMSDSVKEQNLPQVKDWDHAIVWQFIEV